MSVGCRRLQTLILAETSVSDAGLRLLSSHVHSLTWLNLSHCVSVGSVGVQHIAAASPHLQRLNLEWCPIGDTALEALAGCPKLHYLNLGYCRKITDFGLLALATHCPLLRCLLINGCHLVTNKVGLHHMHLCVRSDIGTGHWTPGVGLAIPAPSQTAGLLHGGRHGTSDAAISCARDH